MAAPTVTATLDKPSYNKGDRITLTVNYSDPDNRPVTVTVDVKDSSGNDVLSTTTSAVIDPLTVTVTDDGGRTWAKVTDTGAVAQYTTTA
jgi:hypothetical protein